MDSEERIEFAFPNLRPKGWHLSKWPYAYVLTRRQDDKYIGTYPTLMHVSIRFGMSSRLEIPEEYLVRAIWDDNRAYFVPMDLLFGEDRLLLPEGEITEHYLERNLEDYLVKHFWSNKGLKAKGLPEQWSAASDSQYNYKRPPECIPKIGWVDEHHSLHSANRK